MPESYPHLLREFIIKYGSTYLIIGSIKNVWNADVANNAVHLLNKMKSQLF